MVVASPPPICIEINKPNIELPVIDLASARPEASSLIVKACEEYGFFMVINHGVPRDLISRMEKESVKFFAKPGHEKQMAGPANPFGYGCKNIGFNGDTGEVEYLLFNTNPASIAQRSQTISDDPAKFSEAVNGYVDAVRELACEILEMMAEGMWVPDTSVFSRMIRDVDSDSILRINHYPHHHLPILPRHRHVPDDESADADRPTSPYGPPHHHHHHRVGFGEHSDPQILTLLTSNDVSGLQISLADGSWVPVPPDPSAFCVNVGDALQAMTNGRFVSVRHRALTNAYKARMSMAYFAAPPLHAWIRAPPELVTSGRPRLYRPFTWAEYKKAAHSLRLADTRLPLFQDI